MKQRASRLSEEKIAEIKRMRMNFYTPDCIAKTLKVSKWTVYRYSNKSTRGIKASNSTKILMRRLTRSKMPYTAPMSNLDEDTKQWLRS